MCVVSNRLDCISLGPLRLGGRVRPRHGHLDSSLTPWSLSWNGGDASNPRGPALRRERGSAPNSRTHQSWPPAFSLGGCERLPPSRWLAQGESFPRPWGAGAAGGAPPLGLRGSGDTRLAAARALRPGTCAQRTPAAGAAPRAARGAVAKPQAHDARRCARSPGVSVSVFYRLELAKARPRVTSR